MQRVLVLNKFSIKKFSRFFLTFIFIFAIFAHSAHAAKLDVVPTFGSVNVGDSIKIRVVLSSPDQSANGISGHMSFSNNLLNLTSISKSDSFNIQWAPGGDPSYSNSNGTVTFEGVILPPGYKGTSGVILTLYFKAKSSGTASVKFSNASVLAYDGLGTEILNSTGEARFDITPIKEVVPTPIVDSKPVTATDKLAASISIEEIKKSDDLDPHSRFLITSVNTKQNANYNIVLDNTPYVWNDSGNHVFETVPLSKGIHSLKVSIQSINSEIVSKSVTFSNSGILTPVFTDYSNNIIENEYLVVKGIADPSTFIIITSDAVLSEGGDTKHESLTVKSNEKGLFTYVSENRAVRGVYMISASARTTDGMESSTTAPIKISVNAKTESIAGRLTNIFSTIVPLVAILVLLVLIIVFGWYRIMHYKEKMRKRLLETRAIVDKSFGILQEDLDEEAKILKKAKAMQPLTEDERTFVTQFKKDINAAERTIEEDIKNSDKGI